MSSVSFSVLVALVAATLIHRRFGGREGMDAWDPTRSAIAMLVMISIIGWLLVYHSLDAIAAAVRSGLRF